MLFRSGYRSAGAIVEKADAFIQRNGSRHPKHMRASRPQGEPVRHVNLNDFGQQAHYLAQAAADCTESTAVLYRNNDSALPLIDLLERRGIPYACRQRESFFFTSPAVRDLTDVLCFALDGTDRERFLRIYYKLEVRVKRSVLQEKLRRVPEGAPVLDALIDGGGFEPWQTGRLKALRTHLSKLPRLDRKSTRLNSSHLVISYAVFCLKKKNRVRTSSGSLFYVFFFNDTATTEIYTLSLHDALPI